MELVRIIEHQSVLYSYRATQDIERAFQLDFLFEMSKPRNIHHEWHPLIATPFRYNPPHPQARFRPAYGKNVFYGSLLEETALYEYAFHFMKERMHLKINTETGIRTIFFVEANHVNYAQIKSHPDYVNIMNKNDYSASHQFVTTNPHITFIIYPSCRDPRQQNNAAILDINHLAKNPKKQFTITFFYDNQKKQINWLGHDLSISWAQVL